MNEHKLNKVEGYKEVIPYVYVGMNKCCRPTFAMINGEKVDINFNGPLNTDLLGNGANFIASLIKQKIKVCINYENRNTKAIFFLIAYFIMKGKSIDDSISLIKKKINIFNINNQEKKLLQDFQKQFKNEN
ncbi:MAG: hypothetical protein QW622_01605 [Candidatus Pacearchaeota archaeon]